MTPETTPILKFTTPKGVCPTHGTVEMFTVVGWDGGGEYAKLKCCPKCYIEWIAANVTQVEPL